MWGQVSGSKTNDIFLPFDQNKQQCTQTSVLTMGEKPTTCSCRLTNLRGSSTFSQRLMPSRLHLAILEHTSLQILIEKLGPFFQSPCVCVRALSLSYISDKAQSRYFRLLHTPSMQMHNTIFLLNSYSSSNLFRSVSDISS